jgi:hypothetical protein
MGAGDTAAAIVGGVSSMLTLAQVWADEFP